MTVSDAKRRTFKSAVAISIISLVFLLVIAVASIWINPHDHHISVGSRFHMGVMRRGWDVRLTFFSDDWGPYQGSIISVDDDPVEKKIGFGDTAGLYYRYFRWPDATVWTLAISIWYPIGLSAILPLAYGLKRSQSVRVW